MFTQLRRAFKGVRLMAVEVAHLEESQILDLGKQLELVGAALADNDHELALRLAGEVERTHPDQLELLKRLRDALALSRWAWVLTAFDTPEALCEVGGLETGDETGANVSPHRGLVALAAYRMHQRDFAAASDLMDEWVVKVYRSREKASLTRLAAFRDTLQAWAEHEKLGNAEAQAVLSMSPEQLKADVLTVLRDVERGAGLASLRSSGMQVAPRMGWRPRRKLH